VPRLVPTGYSPAPTPAFMVRPLEAGRGLLVVTLSSASLTLPIQAEEAPDVITRARSGDRQAFAELYDEYVDRVYRYLLYRVREPSDAEDLTSEVFTRAFANIQRYRWQGKSFLAWLYTIARNAVTDRMRRTRPTVDLEDALGLADSGPTAQEHVEALDRAAALKRAMTKLTAEQQEVLFLRFMENYSSQEVARALGKNEGAVRALQFRALGRLRKLLVEEVA
jgi:RNA polymerase sigma-70 factor (ECF subfamily)